MVTIYGQAGCDFCVKAVALCQARKVPYEYKDIAGELQRLEFRKFFPEARTVPQIMMGDLHIGGFTDLQREI